MPVTKADSMDDVPASASTEKRTDELIESLGPQASIQFSIAEVCDGTWTIGANQ